MNITREEIEEKVRVILHEKDLPDWWDLYLPTFKLTANEMFNKDPEKLLIYVDSYSDPSFM